MRHILKRLGGLLLAAALVLSLLPAGASAAADGPETAATSGSASANRPETAQSSDAQSFPEQAAVPNDADPDGVWTAIGALEREALPSDPTETDYAGLLPRVEALVTSRADYVPGSAVYRDGSLLWRTADGNAWGYNPSIQSAVNRAVPMTEEERAAAERSLPAQALAEKSVSQTDSNPYAKDVALFIPWWGKDNVFGFDSYYTCLALAEATGGECRVYLGDEATIDAIADALTSCCVVFINTHGAPGEITLTTGEGITEEDRVGHHAHETIGSTAAYGVLIYAILDGQCLVNHLRGRTVTAEYVSLNACACMGAEGLANPLVEAGVDVVFGWSKVTVACSSVRFAHYFAEGLIRDMTAAEASVYMKQQMCRWVLDNQMTSKENVIAMLEETGMMYWNIWTGSGAVTTEEARTNGAAFPIFVSEQDPYPGEDNVDEIQTVKSTWKLPMDPVSQKNIRVWGKTGAYFVATLPDAFKENIITSTGDAFKENAVYSITLTGGRLPPGISIKPYFDPNYYEYGTTEPVTVPCLYGIPTEPGLYESQLLVELENGKKDTRTATIVIVSEPFAQTEQAVVADAGKEKTVKFTDGHTGTVFKAELKSGRVPPGMVFLSGGGELRYRGTPSQTGTFTAVWRIILTSGKAIEHTITVTVPSRYKETSESISVRKGAEAKVLLTFDGADQVSYAEQISGQLPPGMTFGCSMSEAPNYSGTPQTKGTYQAVLRFFLLDGTFLTHTVTATVYSETASLDVYSMDLSLGETIVPKADHDTWLDRTIACAVNPGNQVKMNVNPSTGEVRLDLDNDGTWDVSVTRENGNAVFRLLPASSLTGDDFILTLNQDALDRADAWGTEDPSAQYAKEIRFHIHTEYDLYISGIRVNSKNRKDIRGDGLFFFDGVDTLVVQGDCSYYGSLPLIQNGLNGLTIRTEEDSVLTSLLNCIETTASLSLTGPGKLTLKSESGSAVVCEKALLDIYNMTLTVQAEKKGVEGTGSGAVHARLRNADVTIRSGEGAMDGFWSIGMTNCMVTEPARGGKGTIGSMACLVNENNELLTDVRISAYQEKYDLIIDGIQVTDVNREDVLGNGIFCFDGKRTLYVNGSYESARSTVIENQIQGLKIDAAPDSVLRTKAMNCLTIRENTLLTGGPLTVVSDSRFGNGISIDENVYLVVSDASLTVQGSRFGIRGAEGTGRFVVRGSDVTVSGTVAALQVPGGLELTQCLLQTPEGGSFRASDGRVVDADGEAAQEVTFKAFYAWPLYICGVQVTELNMADILGDGVFSFDGNRTLTVKGSCTYDGYIIQNSAVKRLIIVIAEDAVLDNGPSGWARPIQVGSSTTITGPGKLTLRGPSFANGLDVMGGDLTLRELDLTVVGGDWGAIVGSGTMSPGRLTIENCSVTASGGSYNSAINSFAGGISLVGCELVSPSGGTVKDGAIVNGDGTAASAIEIRVTLKAEVEGSQLRYTINRTGGSAKLVAAWYDEAGRMLGCSVKDETLDGLRTGTIPVMKDQKEYRLFVLDKNGSPMTLHWSSGE